MIPPSSLFRRLLVCCFLTVACLCSSGLLAIDTDPTRHCIVASSEGARPDCYADLTSLFIFSRTLADPVPGDGIPAGILGDTVETYNFDNVAPLDNLNEADVIWISPLPPDYNALRDVSDANGNGVLLDFVNQGGTLIIHARSSGSSDVLELDIAPGGVDYQRGSLQVDRFSSVTFSQPCHPYLTGEGYDGIALTEADFDRSPSSIGDGFLLGLESIPGVIVIMQANGNPVMIEYPWGSQGGRVIVTTVTYGAVNCNPGFLGDQVRQLMVYGASAVRAESQDSDNDGLTDVTECVHGTDRLNADTDADALTDGEEVLVFLTDPLDPNGDMDADGLTDSEEILMFMTDHNDADSDDDQLLDGEEVGHGTDPLDADTDDDELTDFAEIDSAEGSGCPDPLDADSDDDTLNDGEEVNVIETSPCLADTDGDGLADNVDPDPLNPGDILDIVEDELRVIADDILLLNLNEFNGSRNFIKRIRRNILSGRANLAANFLSADYVVLSLIVMQIMDARIDGEPFPRDWMPEDSAARIDLHNRVTDLIDTLLAELQ